MERDFYTDEFEDLIKLKADQYRMYPSDKVWKGIKRSLHSHKRKYWFGFALLLTGLSYFGIDQLIVSPPSKQVTKPTPASPSPENQQAKIIPFDQVTPGIINDNSGNDNTGNDINSNTRSNSTLIQPELFDKSAVTPERTGSELLPEIIAAPETLVSVLVPVEAVAISMPVPFEIQREISTKHLPFKQWHKAPDMLIVSSSQGIKPDIQKEEDIQKINWLQEYAVYNLAPSKPRRLNYQLSFAPTMNYRRLLGRKNANIQSTSGNIPIALNIEGDLDKLVNHKPALGFELGSFVLYSVNHSLSLKAGLQFNYSRYEIQAYSSATERATIALNSINGLSSSSISNLTQLRNFGGYAVQDLQNQYFQLSIPVGIELNILGNNKLQLGVAGTVQPTYLLNRNTYLISSDYKNYTKEPSLVRRWNVNTSAETFVSYKAAGLKWQVGPQIRYQLLSSYTDKYPIKEYLIEYGVKIGVTKTIR
ncbi:MAG: hypothetical protein H7122_07430 [Chitinophagaceae bacterium]|nr:hypothetical protein [Chitinophagaceae bacterium]